MTAGNTPTPADQPQADQPEAAGPPDSPTGDRPRNAKGRFARNMQTARRDADAADYLADHPGTTYEQLAERFKYCDKGEAWRGVQRAIANVARPAVTKLIKTESDELDLLYTEACAILQRNHVTVSHGKVITWRNPETQQEEPLQDDGPKLQAIQVALRVRESYRKLHGLDQPAKQEISGGVKYEVVGIDPEDLT